MIRFLMHIILCAPFCLVVHEGGHYLVARYLGGKLKFHFNWGKLFDFIPVPRFTWNYPEHFAAWQRSLTAFAGFAFEVIIAVLFGMCGAAWSLPYAVMVLLHLFLYPYYAGEENDFDHIDF